MTISSVMWGASSIWAEMVVSFRLVWLDTTSLVRRYTSSFRPYRATSPMAMNLQAPPRFSAKCREVRPRSRGNDDRGGEEDVVIQDILQSGADGHSQQSADQAEQRGCDKGQHQQVDHKEHRARDLFPRRHIGGALSSWHLVPSRFSSGFCFSSFSPAGGSAGVFF